VTFRPTDKLSSADSSFAKGAIQFPPSSSSAAANGSVLPSAAAAGDSLLNGNAVKRDDVVAVLQRLRDLKQAIRVYE
jgi:hypothetical protein